MAKKTDKETVVDISRETMADIFDDIREELAGRRQMLDFLLKILPLQDKTQGQDTDDVPRADT